jgi:hypothetical protein
MFRANADICLSQNRFLVSCLRQANENICIAIAYVYHLVVPGFQLISLKGKKLHCQDDYKWNCLIIKRLLFHLRFKLCMSTALDN